MSENRADRGLGGGSAPGQPRSVAAGLRGWAFTAMPILTVAVLVLACVNVRHLIAWDAAWKRVFDGIGLYWLVIVGLALLGAAYSWVLQVRGAEVARNEASIVDRDRRLALRFGGAALSTVSLGLALVAFRLAQSSVRGAAQIGAPDRGISFFDMMTWLGTFATLAVVISTALVAIWVKRRDDEAQHSAAVVKMRQAWINKVRGTMAGLLAAGQALRADYERGQSNPDRGDKARLLLREADLLMNPTEGHHAVLLIAVRNWLHHAGIEDHMRSQDALPQTTVATTDFEAVTTWLVLLTQLVLKIEWTVTSTGRERISEKAGSLWDQICVYEAKYKTELDLVTSQALKLRRSHVSNLINGTDDSSPTTVTS